MLRILGLIVLLASVMVGIGKNLAAFMDAPSIIMVVAGPLGILLLGGARIGNMFGAVFSGDATADDLQAAAKAWELARRYTIAAGILATVIGAVIMLKNTDDLAAVRPGAAIAILTVCWSVFLGYYIYLPLQARLEDRAAAAG